MIVLFLLGCAWLAVNVWGAEHSTFLLIAAVAIVQPRIDRRSRRPAASAAGMAR